MPDDIKIHSHATAATGLYQNLYRPGSGLISAAAGLSIQADNSTALFTATLPEKTTGFPASRIAQLNLNTGQTQVLTFGPGTDKAASFAPSGNGAAFLSDRDTRLKPAGDFQLYLLDSHSGEATATARVDGWVEYLHWSPDGRRILLGVAGHGADVASGQGAVTSERVKNTHETWMPRVHSGDDDCQWRSLWIYDLASGEMQPVPTEGLTVWEACWCGNDAVAALTSPTPSEAAWYCATLDRIDVTTGKRDLLYQAKFQLGGLAANPSGRTLAVLESLCSDRGIIAGELHLIDTHSGVVNSPATDNTDISSAVWQSDTQLYLAGPRGQQSALGHYNTQSQHYSTFWCGEAVAGSGFYPVVVPLSADPGDGAEANSECLMVCEGFFRAPEIARISPKGYTPLVSFDHGYRDLAEQVIDRVEAIQWTAPDGLAIQGWLVRPSYRPANTPAEAPYPMVMIIHGGPIGVSAPRCLGSSLRDLLLLQQGYALFWPNPRGSTGRGQAYTQAVRGDMGGKDAQDNLAGVDHLIAQGIADPKRIGVTGGSYGGFMSSWLITQDHRFAAAIPCFPHTHWLTQHLLSNIPYFDQLFLDQDYRHLRTAGADSLYLSRSPLLFADQVRTPTLHIAGARDRCTPPGEAAQFHQALLENDVTSVLVEYPEEGHGVRNMPALFDFAARCLAWFEQHMPVDGAEPNSTKTE